MNDHIPTIKLYDRILRHYPPELAQIIIEYYLPRHNYMLCTFFCMEGKKIFSHIVSAEIKAATSPQEALQRVFVSAKTLNVLVLYPKAYRALGIKYTCDEHTKYNDLSDEDKFYIWKQIHAKYYNNASAFLDKLNTNNAGIGKILLLEEMTYEQIFPTLISPDISLYYKEL